MKKMIAILLTVCMLLGSAAIAEQTLVQQAFVEGLVGLLNSVDLNRDMLTLDVDYLGDSVFDAKLKQQEKLVDVAADVAGLSLKVQASDTDITVGINDTVLNLQYSDAQKMLVSLMENVSGMGTEMQTVQALAQLLLEKVILPDVQLDYTEGMHIAYAATGQTLLVRLGDFVTAVLEDGAFDALLEQALQVIAAVSKADIPTLTELKAAWPQLKQQLAAVETDFEAALDLKITDDRIDATGHIGAAGETYALTLALWQTDDRMDLEGTVSEIRTRGEETARNDITFEGNFIGDDENHTWSFSAHSTQPFITELTADGSKAGQIGTIHIQQNDYFKPAERTPMNQRVSFLLFMNYALTDDGLTAMLQVTPGMWVPYALRRSIPSLTSSYTADVLISKEQCNVNISTSGGQKLITLRLLADDRQQLRRAYAEYCHPFTRQKYTALYEAEKLIITADGITVTCTGAFETNRAYVITLHAEGKSISPEEADAFIRLEYAGEAGDFAVTCKVIGPDGTEGIIAALTCKPTEPIDALLREQEGVIFLTPETVQMLLTQMIGIAN